MTKPKAPRVLDYDEEWGYVVAGTHNVGTATALLVDHLGDQLGFTDGADYLAHMPAPLLIWARCGMDSRLEHAWALQHTEPHARGAFPAVEWRRP